MPFIIIPIPGSSANRYSFRAKARAWKEYTCVACGGTFRTLVQITLAGKGKTAEDAEADTVARASQAVFARVETRPCPGCGCYQPDAELAVRIRKFEPFFALTLFGMAAAVITMPAQVHPWYWILGIALMAAGIVRMIFLTRYNVNRDPRRALAKSGDLIRKHLLEMVTPGVAFNGAVDTMPHTDLGRQRLPITMMIVGALLFVAADVGLWVSGAPLNLDCRPVVVGPGDDVQVYSLKSIATLEGEWNACAAVHLSNADELALEGAALPARSQIDQWDTVFTGEHLSNHVVFPWAQFTVPDSPGLAGRTLHVEASLDLVYPQMDPGGWTFSEVHRSITYDTPLMLSAPGAGARQRAFWWISTIGGAAMILAGSIMPYIAMRRMAGNMPQPRTYPAEQDPA